MKKFISSIAIIVFVFTLSVNLVGAQTFNSDSVTRILNALLKANLIPAQSLQTAKSMLGSYSAYDDTYCYSFNRDLTVGSEGDDVAALQTFLQSEGYLGTIGEDKGFFGILTRAALESYQTNKGIYPATGFFGPITRALVVANCDAPSSNLWTSIVSQDVEIIKSTDLKTTNLKFNYVLDLTAVGGDVIVPSIMKWSLSNLSENLTDGLVVALEKDGKIVSPGQNASIGWGQYSNDIEYVDSISSYVLRNGNSTRIQFFVETGDLSESGTYRVSLVGFLYRDLVDGGVIKQHIINPGVISSEYVKIYPETINSISVNSPADGTIYDGGPSQKITTEWSKYNGDFDYYRVTLTNGVIGNDPVLKTRIIKKSTEFTSTSQKLQEIMKQNWKRTDLSSYFVVEAIKKVRGKEKVVASGMKGAFQIKGQNKTSDLVSITAVAKGEIFEGDKRWDMYDLLLSSSNSKARGWNVNITCSSNIGDLSIKAGGDCGEDYFISGKTNNITIPVGFERLDISHAYIQIKIDAYEGTYDRSGSFIKGNKVGETTYDLVLNAG
jgi:peptidoglycan hydrolase-like protein with peptidoglycan-binding domain